MVNHNDLSKPLAYPSSQLGRTWQRQHPSIGLTPRKLRTILEDTENANSDPYFDLCNDIEEKWPRYATVLGVRKRQVAALSLSVDANLHQSTTTAETEVRKSHATLITEFLDSGILQDNLLPILDAVSKGVSVTEMIWGKGDVWLPKELIPRPPHWFAYICPENISQNTTSRHAKVLMMRTGASNFVNLAPHRFVVHAPDVSSASAHGGGLGRIAAWWYLFYSHTVKDWLGFMETYGKPLRLGRHAPTASDDEKRRLRTALSALGADGTAIIPDNMMIEFLQNAQGKNSTDAYLAMARYIDDRITEVVLGQTLTTDAPQGSFAAAKVHDGVRHDIASADANLLIKTLERDIVKPIIDINFGPQKYYPQLLFGNNHVLSQQEKIENLLKFIPLGLKVSQEQIRNIIGIQAPAEKDDLL